MISLTASMVFVSTETETEALLLETNYIKQMKPRFNVLMRDDKSFPYILLTGDHVSPQITKHRGARNRKGDFFGPFASVWAVNRTLNALQRAFLIRSCTDSFYENRTRPCLLWQIKRCSGPCTGEVSHADYGELVGEARDFLSGRSRAVRERLAHEMGEAAEKLEFERAGRLRDRIAALSAIQGGPGDQPEKRRGGGRLRGRRGGRAVRRRGVLLPHLPELGQPHLLSARRSQPVVGGGARRLRRAILRGQARAAPRAAVASHRELRDCSPRRSAAARAARSRWRILSAASGASSSTTPRRTGARLCRGASPRPPRSSACSTRWRRRSRSRRRRAASRFTTIRTSWARRRSAR